jgi:hypothetical protein
MVIDWSSFSWIAANMPLTIFHWASRGMSSGPAAAATVQGIQTIGVINQIGNDKFMLDTSTGLV